MPEINRRRVRNIQANSNSRNRNTPARNTSSASHSFLSTKNILAVITIILIAAFTIYRYKLNSEQVPEAELLYKFSGLIQGASELEEKLEAALKEESIGDMIKIKLRPVQERVASIRAQVTFYEKNENKILGGPTQFMETALEELFSIEVNITTSLDTEISQMLRDRKERFNDYVQHAMDTDLAHQKFYQTHYGWRYSTPSFLILRENFGIDLMPSRVPNPEESEETIVKLTKKPISLRDSKILKLLGLSAKDVSDFYFHLAVLMEEREKARLKVVRACENHGVDERQLESRELPWERMDELVAIPEIGTALEALEAIHGELMDEIEKNRTLLGAIPDWLVQANMINMALSRRALETVNSNRKEDRIETFVKLRNIIMEDIGGLRSRVQK